MSFWKSGPLLALSLVAAASISVQAADVSPESEYARRIKVYQTIQPHGETPFGENINLYTGDLTFRQADVVLEGNGPTISLVRNTVTLLSDTQLTETHAFGNWSLSVPRIETLIDPDYGWIPLSTRDPNKRCSEFDRPYYYTLMDKGWHGFELVTESGDRQQLIKRGPQNTVAPTMLNGSGQPIAFPIVTQQNWQIGCVDHTANGVAGESFFAVAPNGTKYWFDTLISHGANTVYETDGGVVIRQRRRLATMYVSRIEDRFGNYVTYNFGGDDKLDSITASDGRNVTITWRTDQRLVDFITVTATDATPRTWRYEYANVGATTSKLTAVELPDTTRWTFDLQGIGGGGLADAGLGKCNIRSLANSTTTQLSTVTHPSGLVGKFWVTPTWHARSYVLSSCMYPSPPAEAEPWEENPPLFSTNSLTRKEIAGSGVATQAWTYTYEPATGSTTEDACAVAGTCATTKWVNVMDPSGDLTTFIHSNRWGETEGKLLRVDSYQGASGPALRSEIYTYAASNQGPWPASLGNTFDGPHANSAKSVTWTPQKLKTISQQGKLFTWQAEAFDIYAKPLTVKRFSDIDPAYTRTDTIAYENNLSLWVLGQTKSSTNVNTTVIESRTDYDAATALPIRTYGPGTTETPGKLQILTYDLTSVVETGQRGTLKTVSDGRDNGNFNTTITLSGWKRGIPQLIQFPATPEAPNGSSKSAVVNDHGWINSVTDENGYKTCYGFDAMGRLASITYPSETETETGVCNTSKWAATTRTFEPVAVAEYGIPLGHWKETVSTGNGRQVTYFDALWRPLVNERYDTGNVAATRSIMVTRYDAGGHQSYQSYPLASLTNYATVTQGTHTTYDALDRVTQTRQNWEMEATLGLLTTTTEYLTGFQTKTTNPRNQATTTSYYAYDQPTFDLPRVMLLPEGARTTITRDRFGKPTTLVRSNADSSEWNGRYFAYDANQQLCKRIELETGTTAMGYDAAGNLAWSASGLPWSSNTTCDIDTTGRRVDRTYDARNRVTTLSFPDGVGNQAWVYTLDGLPEQITTYNGASNTVPVINAYHYNRRRLLNGQGESISQEGWYTWGLGYGYNANGHLVNHVYPDNATVDYAPNALGQPTKVGTYAKDVSYHPNGAIAQFTYGNEIVHTLLQQNTRPLPDRSKDTYNGTAVLDDSYTFDANGNVAAISDGLTGANGNRTMTYDGLDRLKTATSPMFGGTITYGYDTLDNLTTLVDATRNLRYCYSANHRLEFVRTEAPNCNTGAAQTTFDYDVQGNLDHKNSQNYDFDFGNRLRTVTGKELYRYDGHGRRVLAWSPVSGKNILSQYGQDGVLRYQRDDRKGKVFDYFYLAGSLVATREAPIGTSIYTVKYQHTDALGSPVVVTDANRTVIERSEYEPYGALLNRPITDGPGYTGHVMDAATGLTYMQQRYYDPQIGRFLSVDPVAVRPIGDNFNRYWYGNNNPYRFTDPDGRDSVGELIDAQGVQAAQGGNALATAGWAIARATWDVFGAEGLSQSLDKGSSAGAGNNAIAVLEVATLGKGSAAAKGGKALGEAVTKGGMSAARDFNQARNAALQWLGERGFKAEKATMGKLGDSAGKPIGMQTADGKVGFRVEYDGRNGAHINVWAGKEKGPHFTFNVSQATVNKILQQFEK